MERTHAMTDHTVAEHVQRLEKQNRTMKALVGVVGAVSCACLLLQLAEPGRMRAAEAETAKSVEAEQFVVRDSMGNGRVMLAMTSAGPMLEFRDARGKTRMSLALEKDDVLMTVYDGTALHSDPHGRVQARLTLNKEGTSVAILDAGAQRGTMVVKSAKAAPALMLLDAGGKTVWSAPPPAVAATK